MWPPHLATSKAQNSHGYDGQQLAELARRLRDFDVNGVTPVLSLRHLSYLTGTKPAFLRAVVGREESRVLPYEDFHTRKRSGGMRLIRDPVGPLKQTQRWLLKHILNARPLSPHCYGVSRDRNSVACARQHCGARWLLKFDIRNFFASFFEHHIYQVFVSLGYERLVAFELARLVTYPVKDPKNPSTSSPFSNVPLDKYSIPAYRCDLIGSLPQGAPTSSRLANLLMEPFDTYASSAAYQMGWHYTRYVDDISLSTTKRDKNICRRDVRKLYHLIRRKLPEGLDLNPEKTSVSPPGSRKVVLGLLVDGDRPRLTRKYRNNVELHIHYCERNGVVQQASKRKFRSPVLLLDHLRGKVSYAHQVDPELAESWGLRLASLRQNFFST